LVFTSRIFDGNEAARMGVVNHSVEQNDAGDAAYHRAIELAKEITPNVSNRCLIVGMKLFVKLFPLKMINYTTVYFLRENEPLLACGNGTIWKVITYGNEKLHNSVRKLLICLFSVLYLFFPSSYIIFVLYNFYFSTDRFNYKSIFKSYIPLKCFNPHSGA